LAGICVEFMFPTCSFIPCRRHKSALSWDPRLSELCTRPPSGIYLACNSIREVIACWWPLCVWCSYSCIVTRIFFRAHLSFLSFWSIHPSSLNTLVCNVRIWIKFVVRKIMSRGALACRVPYKGISGSHRFWNSKLKCTVTVHATAILLFRVGTELKFRPLLAGSCCYLGPLLLFYGWYEERF